MIVHLSSCRSSANRWAEARRKSMLEELKNLCNALNEYAYLNEGSGYKELRKACDELYKAIEDAQNGIQSDHVGIGDSHEST